MLLMVFFNWLKIKYDVTLQIFYMLTLSSSKFWKLHTYGCWPRNGGSFSGKPTSDWVHCRSQVGHTTSKCSTESSVSSNRSDFCVMESCVVISIDTIFEGCLSNFIHRFFSYAQQVYGFHSFMKLWHLPVLCTQRRKFKYMFLPIKGGKLEF